MKPWAIGILIAVAGIMGIGLFFIVGPFLSILAAPTGVMTIEDTDVHGVVLDEQTRVPVQGVRVVVASSLAYGANPPASHAETLSNERGEFRVHMNIGGTTQFDATKRGYLYAGGCRDPLKPVEVLMRSVPPDSGMKVVKSGLMHPESQSVIHLELERGVLAAGDAGEDIRLFSGPNSLVIVAGPGRSIQWQASQETTDGWNAGPINSCEAPAEGYVDSLTVPTDARRGLCFVRRDGRPTYGAFTIDPAVFTDGLQPAVRFRGVLNKEGGRGLCTELKTGWASAP